jgi:prepilin-type N-terminal cleavage/methylation domain
MRSKGFTLIELLIVISLLALTSSIVVPKLWGQYTSFNTQHAIQTFWGNTLKQVRKENSKTKSVFVDENLSWLKARAEEQNLRIKSHTPIVFRADGFVSSGHIDLLTDSNDVWRLEVKMPYGEVEIKKI